MIQIASVVWSQLVFYIRDAKYTSHDRLGFYKDTGN